MKAKLGLALFLVCLLLVLCLARIALSRSDAPSDDHHHASHSYKRKTLIYLSDKEANKPIILKTVPKPDQIQYMAQNVTLYRYNAESIEDLGWGCAWRTIQTCLSSVGIHETFDHLFHRFGPLDQLQAIYQDKYPNEELKSLIPFAPYDLSSGWAEPFIGEMIFHDFGYASNLEQMNGIPLTCHAPGYVFHHETLNFETYRNRILKHFNNDKSAPIMIDDGTYALNILGVGLDGSELNLWIGDPHIKKNSGDRSDGQTPAGLYTVTLNDVGQQIKCSLEDKDKHQVSWMLCSSSYEGIDFETKRWMVLFPVSDN